MLHRRLAALAAIAASALPALAGAAPAGAATVAQGTSSNWAGYAASGAGARFRAVTASWVQPQVSCSSQAPRFAAMWIGLGGYHTTSRALEQIGTESDCIGGVPRYGAWYELVPAPSRSIPMAIQPGDRVVASVHVAGRAVSLRLRDVTRGTVFTRRLRAPAVDVSSAEWIVEAPAACTTNASGVCHVMPLANFGSAQFTAAHATSATGHRGTISDPRWVATAIDLAGGGPTGDAATGSSAGATTGALDATGSAFGVTYVPGAGEGSPGAAGPTSAVPTPGG